MVELIIDLSFNEIWRERDRERQRQRQRDRETDYVELIELNKRLLEWS